MASRRTMPLPIPGDALQRMQAQLSPHYGSEVWEQDGNRVLVIRTPGLDPDVVNDLEAAVEHLSPGDVRSLQACLLVGASRSTAVSVGPLQDLMAQRVRQDRQVAQLLRGQVPGRQGHILYRAPDDPKRLGRLGIRIPHGHARDIEDEDLDILADTLGPHLDTPAFTNIRAVYILADQDDVRLDADLFLQDLRDRWQDDSRRVEAERRAEEERRATELRRKQERDQIMHTLRQRYIGADERHAGSARSADRLAYPGAREASARAPETRHGREDTGRRVDAVLARGRTGEGSGRSGSALTVTRSTSDHPGTARGALTPPTSAAADRPAPIPAREGWSAGPTEPAVPPTPDHRTLATEALEAAGFDVLADPSVPGHRVDLAAERDADHPRRIIVRFADRLGVDLADEVLASCRALECDMALVVADAADEEARERFIATKAKWVPPADLADLRL